MDQLTHDVRRANWFNIITECQQRPAGVTAKQWLADNGIQEKAYYYWLRKFRREAGEQMSLPAVADPAEVTFAEFSISAPDTPSQVATDNHATVVIHAGDITLELSNDVSEPLLHVLLQEVLHA